MPASELGPGSAGEARTLYRALTIIMDAHRSSPACMSMRRLTLMTRMHVWMIFPRLTPSPPNGRRNAPRAAAAAILPPL